MADDMGAPPSGSGSCPTGQAAAHLAASRGDPSRKAVTTRLHKEFQFVFQGGADCGILKVSGPMENQDQLDAVVTALGVMRGWLPEYRDSDRSGEAVETLGSTEGESAGRNGIAQDAVSTPETGRGG